MTSFPLALFAGVALDLLVGDPRWLPHPVAAIGKLATAMETLWRATKIPLRIAGILAWFSVVASAAAVTYFSLRLLPSPWIQIYWIYSFLAVRSLDDHARLVIRSLRASDLSAARSSLSMIVGRDTAHLDEQEITRAVFETVAESLNDGVIAPLFWLFAAGPVGMAVYKAANTLDSMFGHRDDRYREFGWASARMDDLLNLVPARITAILIWLVALLLPGLDAKSSVRVTLRDARKQPSPNSGYPEAAAAGALRIRLGGVNFYRGVRSEKAFLGDATQPLSWRLYTPLRRIVYSVTILFVLLGGIAWV